MSTLSSVRSRQDEAVNAFARPGINERAPAWIAGTIVVFLWLVLLIFTDLTVTFAVASAVLAGLGIAALLVYLYARRLEGHRKALDRAVMLLVLAALLVALAPLVSLVFTVAINGAARFDVEFFTTDMRAVLGPGGGALHAIIGTLIITGLCTLISVPIGILTAIYLVEYGRGSRMSRVITFLVDVMTGIPSIIAGLFAIGMFIAVTGNPGIRNGFIASVGLSVLMIPVVIRSTEELLKLVPQELREASYGLGASKYQTITRVVVPTAAAGIITGIMLAIARVIGDTAVLLVTAGATDSVNWNPFEGRMAALPTFTYQQYASATVPPEFSFNRAWAGALTLIVIILALNLLARVVASRLAVKAR